MDVGVNRVPSHSHSLRSLRTGTLGNPIDLESLGVGRLLVGNLDPLGPDRPGAPRLSRASKGCPA